jgi:hypothetical protein
VHVRLPLRLELVAARHRQRDRRELVGGERNILLSLDVKTAGGFETPLLCRPRRLASSADAVTNVLSVTEVPAGEGLARQIPEQHARFPLHAAPSGWQRHRPLMQSWPDGHARAPLLTPGSHSTQIPALLQMARAPSPSAGQGWLASQTQPPSKSVHVWHRPPTQK